MPSIADATRDRRSPERRRLVVGVGLLLVGAALVGLGAAGAAGATTTRTGAAVGGLAVLGGMLAVAARAPLDEHERTVAAAGTMLGMAGVLLFWAVAPADLLAGPGVGAVVTGLGALFGVATLLAAVLAAVSLGPTGSTAASRSPAVGSSSVGWRRGDGGPTRETSADGSGREGRRSSRRGNH